MSDTVKCRVKFKSLRRGCLLLIGAFFSPVLPAQAFDPTQCAVEGYEGELFASVYEQARHAAKVFCKEFYWSRIENKQIDDAHIGSVLSDFAVHAEQALDEKGLRAAADYDAQFERLGDTFGRFDSSDFQMPEFIVESSITSADTKGYFTGLDPERFTIENVDRCNAISSGSDCATVFREFGNAFNPYRSSYNRDYKSNSKKLARLSGDWDRFLEVSKSQSGLEVLLTSLAHRDHFKAGRLVGPPGYQVIALHPHAVYNSMDSAPDGGKQQMGLAVEWLGVNFWDWKLPMGVSLASVYVDRATAENVGHGVMLHFDNRYAIGWADHEEGDDSIYVTLDLLKLFENKKDKYDRYLSYF